MSEFDIEEVKTEIRDTIRDNIMPKNTFALEEFDLSDGTDNYEVAQSFIPYSSVLGTHNSYSETISLVLKKYGSPTEGLSVYLESSSDDLPSGTSIAVGSIAPDDVSTVSTTVGVTMSIKETLGTKTEYWIRVVPNESASTVNYYSILRDTVDINYLRGSGYSRTVSGTWSTFSKDIYFEFITPNWIFGNYPHQQLSLWSYPRVAVDVISRPRVIQRYINHKISEYRITSAITVYSRYPDETNKIISDIDKKLFRERINISGIQILNPGDITPIAPYRNKLFVRALRFELVKRVTAP